MVRSPVSRTPGHTPHVERGYDGRLPFGWYCLGRSRDLAAGELRRIDSFGQEWVLFRDTDGRPGLLDPYCPHLGAHLGVGGKVDGKLLRCPFHAWGFDRQGYCRDIPYARRPGSLVGGRRLIRALPVVDHDTLLWAWYHAAGEPPRWPLAPAEPVCGPELAWSGFEGLSFDIACSIQDILENSVDYAHLKYVHGHAAILPGQCVYDGIHRQARIETGIECLDPDGRTGPCHYRIDIRQTGPGQMQVMYTRRVRLRMLFLVTPVQPQRSLLRMLFSRPGYPAGSWEARAVADLEAEKIGHQGGLSGVQADLPIWNHKIYRARPLLCDGDRDIAAFRRWFAQFYPATA